MVVEEEEDDNAIKDGKEVRLYIKVDLLSK